MHSLTTRLDLKRILSQNGQAHSAEAIFNAESLDLMLIKHLIWRYAASMASLHRIWVLSHWDSSQIELVTSVSSSYLESQIDWSSACILWLCCQKILNLLSNSRSENSSLRMPFVNAREVTCRSWNQELTLKCGLAWTDDREKRLIKAFHAASCIRMNPIRSRDLHVWIRCAICMLHDLWAFDGERTPPTALSPYFLDDCRFCLLQSRELTRVVRPDYDVEGWTPACLHRLRMPQEMTVSFLNWIPYRVFLSLCRFFFIQPFGGWRVLLELHFQTWRKPWNFL